MRKVPVKKLSPCVCTNHASDPASQDSISVLLIDNHAVVRSGLRLLLEDVPGIYTAGEAANGREALEFLAEHQPGIILFEYLGRDNNIDLLPQFLEASPQSRLIVLTGCHDVQKHRRSIMSGAHGLVLKDQDPSVLIKAVRRVHAGELWIERALMHYVMGEMLHNRNGDPEAAKISTLTARELEIIMQIGEGLKNKHIAERLFISQTTVRHHLTSIFSKLDVCDRLELVIYAYRYDLCCLSRDTSQPKAKHALNADTGAMS